MPKEYKPTDYEKKVMAAEQNAAEIRVLREMFAGMDGAISSLVKRVSALEKAEPHP